MKSYTKKLIYILIIIVICIILLNKSYHHILKICSNKEDIIPVEINTLDNFTNIDNFRTFNPSIFQLDIDGQISHIYTYRTAIGGSIINLTRLIYLLNNNRFCYSTIKMQYNKCLIEIDIPKPIRDIYHRGFEDARSVVLNDYLYLICSTLDPEYKKNSMWILHIRLDQLKFGLHHTESINTTIMPEKCVKITPSLVHLQPQKNWTPFIYNNELHLIYSFNPFRIFKINPHTGSYIETTNKVYSTLSNNIRGGSNAILFGDNTYLTVVHYRFGLIYTHQFILFNLDGIISISPEFIILRNEILFLNDTNKNILNTCKNLILNTQFVSGIIEYNSDSFKITYGELDYYSKELIIKKTDIQNKLN